MINNFFVSLVETTIFGLDIAQSFVNLLWKFEGNSIFIFWDIEPNPNPILRKFSKILQKVEFLKPCKNVSAKV